MHLTLLCTRVKRRIASETSDRYLIYTIVFASVLFFAGISGKFNWHAMGLPVLVIGWLAMLAALAVMFTLPRA